VVVHKGDMVMWMIYPRMAVLAGLRGGGVILGMVGIGGYANSPLIRYRTYPSSFS